MVSALSLVRGKAACRQGELDREQPVVSVSELRNVSLLVRGSAASTPQPFRVKSKNYCTNVYHQRPGHSSFSLLASW